MALEDELIDFHRGERIGKYEVLTQLTVGGMAELFLGYTSGPGGFRKYVVIKRILPDARSNDQFVRMFLDEARITAAFNHPNIAQVFDLGEEDDGLYLAMEFIGGQNLNQVTSACMKKRQPVPLAFTLSVARDVCLALHYAHTFTSAGGEASPVIHRDVAQKNIMVTYDGTVKLLDFGIAKAKNSLERTSVGTVKGTTGYMSPEQVRGDSLDGRSDLFSVGVVMHELITGERLFAGKTERDEMVKILEDAIPWPSVLLPHVSEDISRVVMRALERNVDRRYPSGRDMARAIEKVAGGKLMDADQRAALMKSLFAERMAATRSLLESADVTTSSQVLASAKRALQKDDGPYLPERKATALSVVEARKKAEIAKLRAEAPGSDETAPPVKRSKLGRVWALMSLSLFLGLAYGAFRLTQLLEAEEKAPPPPPMGLGAMVPILPPNAPVPGYDVAVVEPDKDKDKDTKDRDTKDRDTKDKDRDRAGAKDRDNDRDEATSNRGSRKGKGKGEVTLFLDEPAEIFFNNKSLGRAPLVKRSLPVGQAELVLVGEDKKRRVLAVPVETGKPVRLNLKLRELPGR
ncbi:serine/threonine protein kinase [Corallococcus exiguus]|uniref:serine/threonine protein kinase n=1 Tax=Corallococcus exiguus TaxID=83462 RepID=UPI00149443F3|nr:serine/threonine-protein kinase [Corallococcus exiguus]NPC73613.1 serine/threonine protein kinase [Corallococcus exiguus]